MTSAAPAAAGPGSMAPLLVAAAAIFAVMHSTQAILPELGDEFGASPSQAGLSVSVVIGALAVAAWFWGPLSDRIGRRASLVPASGAIVVPTLLVALAPSFAVLPALRAVQGLCMPGHYVAGALGGYLPGIAFERWEWAGVAGMALGAYAIGIAAVARGSAV